VVIATHFILADKYGILNAIEELMIQEIVGNYWRINSRYIHYIYL